MPTPPSTAHIPPLYRQCEADLRARIERDEFGAEGSMPTEEELCRAYGVSRITVRRALSELIRVGLVSRRQGLGTFAKRPQARSKSLSLVGALGEAMSFIEGVTHTLARRAPVVLPDEVARAFAIPAERVDRFDLVFSRGLPFAYTSLFVPERTAATIDDDSIADATTSVYHLVEDKSGHAVAHVDQTFAAVPVPAPVAVALRLRKRTPVLRALRAYFSSQGDVIHTAMIHYHPQRFNVAIRFIG
jgi:GntR family transcriptional regulator